MNTSRFFSAVINPFTHRPLNALPLQIVLDGDALLEPSLRRHIELRSAVALARWRRKLEKVVVRLSSLNAPCRGANLMCRIEIHPLRGRPVLARGLGLHLQVAFDEAIDRAKHAAADQLGRQAPWRRDRRRVAIG